MADDYPVAAYGIRAALLNAGALDVVTVTTREQFILKARELEPDAFISELKLQDGYAMPAIARIRAMYWQTPFIVFTRFDHNDMMMRAMALRVMAFVRKSQPVKEFIDAVAAALKYQRTWKPKDVWTVMRWRGAAKANGVMDICITPPQLEALLMVMKHRAYPIVASKLKKSVVNIKMNMYYLMKELGFHAREDVIEWFKEQF